MIDSAPGSAKARARPFLAALLTVLIVVAIWWIIDWRSAPPPWPGK